MYVYARTFIHCLYLVYARKINLRTHVEITSQWKSTLTDCVLFSLVRVLAEPVRLSHLMSCYRGLAWKIVWTCLVSFVK